MSSIPERLAEAAKGVGISSVYGEPLELNGITVVPVALSFHGFSGGEWHRAAEAVPVGSGGGGVAASVPIGAYVRDIRGVHFRANPVSLLAVGIPFVWVAGHVLIRLTKLSRKKRR